LTRKYGTPVINARDWLGEDDFLDSHHLLVEAAGKFTHRLAEEALLPLLRGTVLPAGRPPAPAATLAVPQPGSPSVPASGGSEVVRSGPATKHR
jgi:hypothetical protein